MHRLLRGHRQRSPEGRAPGERPTALAAVGGMVLCALVVQQGAVKQGGLGTFRSEAEHARPNVLLILADDLGIDHLGWHPVGASVGNPAPTPVLDQLSASGIVFTDAYATPICGPTRACLLTGRFPYRHGLGDNPRVERPQLQLSEWTLAEALWEEGYQTGAFGKWHVSLDRDDPNAQGFRHFDGMIVGLKGKSYTNWSRVINGQSFNETQYETSVVTDSAIAWIQSVENQPGKPVNWFAYVAYSAPHKPLEAPPLALDPITQAQPNDPPGVIYHGMIEALDTEIGRLMDVVDLERTLVLFFGDNGTAKSVAQGPIASTMAKHSIYEGGVRVPAFAAGATVAGSGRRAGLVHIVDVYGTVLHAVGAPQGPAPIDSVSLLAPHLSSAQHWMPRRKYLFTERFEPSGRPPKGPFDEVRRSVRNSRYKLIRTEAGDEFYDVLFDPWETNDLLNGVLTPKQQNARATLELELESLLAS